MIPWQWYFKTIDIDRRVANARASLHKQWSELSAWVSHPSEIYVSDDHTTIASRFRQSCDHHMTPRRNATYYNGMRLPMITLSSLEPCVTSADQSWPRHDLVFHFDDHALHSHAISNDHETVVWHCQRWHFRPSRDQRMTLSIIPRSSDSTSGETRGGGGRRYIFMTFCWNYQYFWVKPPPRLIGRWL